MVDFIGVVELGNFDLVINGEMLGVSFISDYLVDDFVVWGDFWLVDGEVVFCYV